MGAVELLSEICADAPLVGRNLYQDKDGGPRYILGRAKFMASPRWATAECLAGISKVVERCPSREAKPRAVRKRATKPRQTPEIQGQAAFLDALDKPNPDK
jgi:hypothetical protein